MYLIEWWVVIRIIWLNGDCYIIEVIIGGVVFDSLGDVWFYIWGFSEFSVVINGILICFCVKKIISLVFILIWVMLLELKFWLLILV